MKTLGVRGVTGSYGEAEMKADLSQGRQLFFTAEKKWPVLLDCEFK